jgi:hypothetical protein
MQIGFGFSKARAAQMHRAGLKRIQDAWEDGSLISIDRAKEKFGLKAGEDRAWLTATNLLTYTWAGMLRGINPVAGRQEWLGIFGEAENGLPQVVFQTGDSLLLRVGAPMQNLHIPWHIDLFAVQEVSRTLVQVRALAGIRDGIRGFGYVGRLLRIRISEIEQGPKKTKMLLYFGEIAKL